MHKLALLLKILLSNPQDCPSGTRSTTEPRARESQNFVCPRFAGPSGKRSTICIADWPSFAYTAESSAKLRLPVNYAPARGKYPHNLP